MCALKRSSQKLILHRLKRKILFAVRGFFFFGLTEGKMAGGARNVYQT